MSDSLTKHALAYMMKDMLRERPLSRISVSALCARCKMNRKRFYYHFSDKYSLVCWMMRTDLEEELQTGEGDTLTCICGYFLRNRALYQRIFAETDHIDRELGSVLLPMLLPLCPYELPEEEHQFCMNVLTDAFVAAMRRWLAEDEPMAPERCAALIRSMSGGHSHAKGEPI